MAAALSFRAVVKHYRAGIQGCSAGVGVLRGVDLDVEAGECVAVVGAPGAGTSTLLLCGAGLLRPDAGTVTLFGEPVDGRADGVAYVTDLGTSYGFLTARESMEFHARSRIGGPVRGGDAVRAALARAGLSAVGDTRIARLRPGARRRLALAHALLDDPRLLLVDAPLSGLSPPDERDVGETIASLAADGMTVVISTRQAERARGFTSRAISLVDGRIETPASQSRRPYILTLTVGPVDGRARRALAEQLPDARQEGTRLFVPLHDRTPEAVLALCGQLGLSVLGSRVIASLVRQPTGRVAESLPDGGAA